jgi:transposase
MLKIREVKTSSGSIAVQVIYYYQRKRVIVKHFGSAKNPNEVQNLRLFAQEFIKSQQRQTSIFPHDNPNAVLYVEQCYCVGVYYGFFYSTIRQLIHKIGFTRMVSNLILDLVVMRLLEPSSKLKSIELLQSYFGITHQRQSYYKEAKKCLLLKEHIQEVVISFAKAEHGFDYSMLFYDVTTLYFETFEEDELRKNGFSKDGKSQQPQILVALMVSPLGFPVSFEIFTGNTFEGNTIIPTIKSFIKQHQVKNFTVVADAAMISMENIKALKNEGIHYIVGARLGNLNHELIEIIDKNLIREDAKISRIDTDKGALICSFSSLRYRKDKYEMDKQLLKAQNIIDKPFKIRKAKYVKAGHEKLEMNELLIKKNEKLLGVKGYYTDIPTHILSNKAVIEHYHQLYKIEHAFRIAKSDLKTRPIFHFKEEPIKLHLMICFMALVIAKHIELKTGDSIKKFISESKKVTDAKMINNITQKEIVIKGKETEKALGYIRDLNLSH